MAEDRALAGYVMLQFLGSLAFFAILWIVMNEALIQLGAFDGSLPFSNSTLQEGRGYVESAWTFSPLFAAAASTLALQARAAFESAGGVR